MLQKKGKEMKRTVSIILVLVMCFALVTMTASASKFDKVVDTIDDVTGTIDKVSTVVDGETGGVFQLSPMFSQLFETLHLDKVWDFIDRILNALHTIDVLI